MDNPQQQVIDETRPADGGQRYPAVSDLKDLILMLDDGRFNAEASEDLLAFSEEFECRGCDAGKKVKGKVTISIDVERDDDGTYFFTPNLTVKLPARTYRRTIGWVDEKNRFTPNKPGQGNFFGTMREVTGPAREIR